MRRAKRVLFWSLLDASLAPGAKACDFVASQDGKTILVLLPKKIYKHANIRGHHRQQAFGSTSPARLHRAMHAAVGAERERHAPPDERRPGTGGELEAVEQRRERQPGLDHRQVLRREGKGIRFTSKSEQIKNMAPPRSPAPRSRGSRRRRAATGAAAGGLTRPAATARGGTRAATRTRRGSHRRCCSRG